MKAFFGVGDGRTALSMLGGHGAMVSFAYYGTTWLSEEEFASLLDVCDSVVVDSGAFTIWKSGQKIDWAPYIDRYRKFVDRFRDRIKWAVTFDVIDDADASMRNWQAFKKEGISLVPVWHEGDPTDHLKEYNPGERLVCLGRIAGRSSKPATFRFYDEAFNAFPLGLFHALGNTSPETLEPYPFDSFDSVSWQRNANYSMSHPFPWNRCSSTSRLRAYIEAVESIQYRANALEVGGDARQATLPLHAYQREKRVGLK